MHEELSIDWVLTISSVEYSNKIAVGGRRACVEGIVDDGDGYGMVVGGGGVDEVDPSRSLFIELDV